MTLKTMYLKVRKHHWQTKRYIESGWAAEVERYFTHHIEPAFGHKKLVDISIREVREFHRSLSDTPVSANRCLEVLSKIYNHAREYEYTPLNPCELVRAFPEKKRSRYASDEELARIHAALKKRAADKPREVAFVQILLHTGARPRSILRARRDQLRDIGLAGVLTFRGKTSADSGEDETVIFPKQVMDIIATLPVRKDGLLLGPVSYRRFWESIAKEADCPDLWLRDLRRTYGTQALSCGVGLSQLGEMLNHKSEQTTKRYAKLMPDKRIELAQKISLSLALRV